MATRPYSACDSPRSSRTLITNTVLENDSAKASRAIVRVLWPASIATPATAASHMTRLPRTTLINMCSEVVNQTSRRSRMRTSSLSPMAKSNSVTPP